MNLQWWEREILVFLEEDSGRASGDIGRRVWPSLNPRMRSAAAANHLRNLERRGLVRRMDDQRPIAWMRTPEGTRALAAEGDGNGDDR